MVFIVLVVLLDLALPLAKVIPWPWGTVGIIPLGFGIWLHLDADRAFKDHGTTFKPFEQSKALVTKGSYSFSRHPMYLGMMLITAGLATILGPLAPFLVVLILWIVLDRRFVLLEEHMINTTFKQDWRTYTSCVRRWM